MWHVKQYSIPKCISQLSPISFWYKFGIKIETPECISQPYKLCDKQNFNMSHPLFSMQCPPHPFPKCISMIYANNSFSMLQWSMVLLWRQSGLFPIVTNALITRTPITKIPFPSMSWVRPKLQIVPAGLCVYKIFVCFKLLQANTNFTADKYAHSFSTSARILCEYQSFIYNCPL